MMKSMLSMLALLLSTQTYAAGTNLIINGSFEDPDVASGNWQVFTSITGWSTEGAGVEVRDNKVGTTQFGNQYAELDSHGANSNSSIIQSIVTEIGQSYLLSFYYSPRINQSSTTNGISVFWNGSLLQDISANGSSVNVWTLYNFVVTGTGQDTLKFKATGIQDTLGGNIDNVALNAVPVPAAAWLFGSALGLLGLARRKA